MGPTEDQEITFVCPECGESLSVNASMKEALIEQGCVLCDARVTSEAFTDESEA